MAADCILEPHRLDPIAEQEEFAAALVSEGAVASFTGLARPDAKAGGRVEGLFLDHHPRLTLRSMQEIASAARGRFAISALRIVHRCGLVEPGEAIVFVAAASLHRRAALEAVDYMMDRLKTEAVFWKCEELENGEQWVEPTAADYRALERWGHAHGWH